MRRLILSSCLAAVAGTALAESSITNRLPEVVVTATRVPMVVDTVSQSVSIIDREQIEQTQARTVEQALRELPGLDVVETGQPGGPTSVFLRGANSQQTLVLVDGVRVNDPFNSGFNFANLPVDNIERIEVLRGPQSVLYGSEAMGGVINIVTRHGSDQPTATASFEGGSHDSWRGQGSFTGTFGKLALSGESSYFTTDNDRLNSENRLFNAAVRGRVQVLEHLDVGAQISYNESHTGTPGDRFTNDPNDSTDFNNLFVATTIHGQPTDWWDIRLQLSHARNNVTFDGPTPNPPWMAGDSYSHTSSDRDQIDLQQVFTINEQHQFLLGGTLDHSPATLHSTSDYGTNNLDRSLTSEAVYGQYNFTPVERLTATVGGRLDNYSSFGTHGTYRVGGRWTTPVTETILRASVGTGFRAPSISDLYYPGFSNPDLKPESNLGWEFGVEQPLAGDKLRIGATYFQNRYEDLIQFVYPLPVNVGKAETLGMETFATWLPVSNLTVRGAYTWLPLAENSDTHQRLLRRAQHSGSLSVNYRFLQRFSAYTTIAVVGDRPDFDGKTFGRTSNPGYITANLGLSADMCRNFTIFGRVENLFDRQYEEAFGFPSLGRTVWGGCRVKF